MDADPESPQDDACGLASRTDPLAALRVAALFIILFSSSVAALLPVLLVRHAKRRIPALAFDFAKYFGSGVIIATAFIHLLAPALEALGSHCLKGTWTLYPWALGIAMTSVFGIFFVELIAFRWGTNRLRALGTAHDPHGHGTVGGTHAAHGPEPTPTTAAPHLASSSSSADEKGTMQDHSHSHSQTAIDHALAQIVGIGILEFGVVLHSFLIGLTLAVDEQFKILFVVLVFHQMFEGLGLGSRLAQLRLPPRYRLIPIAGAVLYGVTTPLGIAVGLGIRTTYNPEGTTASIVAGIMDSLCAGILLYTGLVELLAHEFLFNPQMSQASNKRVAFASVSLISGAALMALLGRWA